MKRLLAILLLCFVSLFTLAAEEKTAPYSFGMQFAVDYDIVTGDLLLWNLRYGIGIDFLVHLGASFYLGAEVLALFGFHKQTLNDPAFDRIYVQFPMHLNITAFFSGFSAQLFAGVSYTGEAGLNGGTVYIQDFSFRLLPDVGAKIGWGTVNNVFIKGGYVFDGYAYFGLGVRLGLF